MTPQTETKKTQSYATKYFPALTSTCKILCELTRLNISTKSYKQKSALKKNNE